MIDLVFSNLNPYKQGYGIEIENCKQKRWKLASKQDKLALNGLIKVMKNSKTYCNNCIVLAQIMTIFNKIHTRILFLGER